MTILAGDAAVRGTVGARGPVLAVLPLDGPTAAPVLRYAALVAAVDGRGLRVMALRRRGSLSTDAALLAVRRRRHDRIRRLVGAYEGVRAEVDELAVSRRTARDPLALGEKVLAAARARGAAVVVLPDSLAATGLGQAPGLRVVTVLGRPGAR